MLYQLFNMPIIELIEYKSTTINRSEIPGFVVKKLKQEYSNQVKLEADFSENSPECDRWKIKAQGWVGYIPLTPDFQIIIQPKVPLSNLFGMLEYAYNLKSFRFLDGLVNCESLQEFYNFLVNILTKKILDQARKGFYRAYLSKTENLTYIRGRIDMQKVVQKPWDVNFKCDYQEHTRDISDNQILAWTLFVIGRSGFCSEKVAPIVAKAFHILQGLVSLQPFKSTDCLGKKYHRLNEDYQPLHALCRFFLDNIGANHQRGERSMLPFLVDMARLYEKFVAEWLKFNLPSNLRVKEQEKVDIINPQIYCRIDLVIYEVKTDKVVYIIDTKYKLTNKPSTNDINQVVAYATYKNCKEAVLVYPKKLTNPINQLAAKSKIRLRSLTFSLDANLEKAGQDFLDELIN
ncbi:MAG: restriction endonuclease [Microcoleaceae cyanobacterium]